MSDHNRNNKSFFRTKLFKTSSLKDNRIVSFISEKSNNVKRRVSIKIDKLRNIDHNLDSEIVEYHFKPYNCISYLN